MTRIRSRTAIALSLLLVPAVAAAQTPPDGAVEGATPEELMPAVPDEPEPEPEPEKPTSGYDKGFFIKTENDKGSFALKIGARVQTLWSFDSRDGDPRDNQSQFQLRRARMTLEGHAFTEKLAYKFQPDFGRGFVALRDFYLDGQVADDAWVRVGQWKRPFSRQQINSSGRLELVDRSITDAALAAGRDLGVALHNQYEKSPDTEWAVGVFNGQGENPVFAGEADPMTGDVTGTFSNVPRKFLPVLIARFGLNRGGIKGYAEADLEGGGLRWSAAASAWIEADFDDNGFTRRQAEADFVVKNNGLSVSGMVAFMRLNGPMDALDQNAIAAHVQAGKMFGEGTRRMQPAIRYGMVMGLANDANPDAETLDHEITGGFGWYPYAHELKLQVDVGSRFSKDGGPADRLLGRMQLSFSF